MPDALLANCAKTDGMPLFIEELTKVMSSMALSRSPPIPMTTNGDPAKSMVPVTLQDSLLARIDRLTESKFVAQIGAVIGREFTFNCWR